MKPCCARCYKTHMVINRKSICLHSQDMYTTGKERLHSCSDDRNLVFGDLLRFVVSRHSLNLLFLTEGKNLFAVFEGCDALLCQ